MKKFAIAILLGGLLMAADKPKDMSVQDQENMSRLMIKIMQANNDATRVEAVQRAAVQQYQSSLTLMQEKYGAKGCDLNVDKQWVCPPEVKKPDAKPAPITPPAAPKTK